MSYNKDNIYKQSLKIASEKDVYFIEDIIASLPLSKATFYDFFPPESNELNAIKAKLEANKVDTKKKLRKRWNDDESASVLQIALYKLIGTEEESNRINSQFIRAEVKTEITDSILKAFEGVTDESIQSES